MPNVLLVHASAHGHTRRIAERIADIVRAGGGEVWLERVNAHPALTGCDAVVVGATRHKGHHPTDTSRDYDYTDWNAVERFAHDCAAAAGERAATA